MRKVVKNKPLMLHKRMCQSKRLKVSLPQITEDIFHELHLSSNADATPDNAFIRTKCYN